MDIPLCKLSFCLMLAVAGLTSDARAEAAFERSFAHGKVHGREPAKITCTPRAEGGDEVVHTGKLDWAFYGIDAVAVKPGETYSLSCTSSAMRDGRLDGKIELGAILRRKGRDPVWVYGKVVEAVGRTHATSFVIPTDAISIEPRVTGHGPVAATFSPLVLRRTGSCTIGTFAAHTLSNATLIAEINPMTARFTVTDRRNGRVWRPAELAVSGDEPGIDQYICLACKAKAADFAEYTYASSRTGRPVMSIRWTLDGAEMPIAITPVDANAPIEDDRLNYPPAPEPKAGMRLVVANSEGLSYPVDEEHENFGWLTLCQGWSSSMSFFGMHEGCAGAGVMFLVETPCDVHFVPHRMPKSRYWTMAPRWYPSRKTWYEPRLLRLVFFTSGGHVAMAKRYREYARQMGWLKTFREKAIRRPDVNRLVGAVNFWYWDNEIPQDRKEAGRLAMIDELLASGITHFLWSHGGGMAVSKKVKASGNLIGCYDVMQDVYTPEVMEKTGRKGVLGKNGEAWPNDVIWNSPDSNDWARAWGIELKDGSVVNCARICDAKATQYLRRRIGRELRLSGHNARFMDVTGSAGPNECWHPAHALSRNESLVHRLDLLRSIGDEHGVVVGTENGIDAAVPYFDYGEGIMSIGWYRLPRAGRDVGIPWTNAVPAKTMRYQVGEKYRIPLWELVFHDCAAAHWYWGDCNDRSVEMWPKRDLFSLLYAVSPMYVCRPQEWRRNKALYLRSYKLLEPVATACGFSEMTDHQVLTEDWSVQRTVFANGWRITVNFGAKPYVTPEGATIAPFGHEVIGTDK